MKIDIDFENLLNTKSSDEIAAFLSEDGKFEKQKGGLTNSTYKIKWQGEDWVFRVPGFGTEKFINREKENFISMLASKHGVCPETFFCADNKIKFVKYFHDAHTFDWQTDRIESVVAKLKKLYEIQISEEDKNKYERSLLKDIEIYENMFDTKRVPVPNDYYEIREFLLGQIYTKDGKRKYELELHHGDPVLGNLLVNKEGEVAIIDFEYSGTLSRKYDYGHICSRMEQGFGVPRRVVAERIVKADETVECEELIIWSLMADFYEACWGLGNASIKTDEDIETYLNYFKANYDSLKKGLKALEKK